MQKRSFSFRFGAAIFMMMPVLVTVVTFSAHAVPSTKLFLKRQTIQTTRSLGQPQFFEQINSNERVQVILQFNDTISSADQRAVAGSGLIIKGYVPDNAYLIAGKAGAIQTFAKAHANVQAVIPFQSEWKISDEFTAASIFNQNQITHVQVRLLKGEKAESLPAIFESLHAKVLQASGREFVVELPIANIQAIANHPAVEWVQPLAKIQTMMIDLGKAQDIGARLAPDALTGFESGTRVMKFEPAWARGYTGKGQTVAMADTGFDTGDLTTINNDAKDAVIGGVPLGFYSTSWGDPQGHGTHVTGTVIGNGADSAGLVRGGAYGAKYYVESMWSPFLENLGVPSDLGKMFQQAYDQGARVHTNSWGAPANLGTYDDLAAQVDDFLWNHPDMLILFAAGNSGVDDNHDGIIDLNSVSSPATAKNTLTVGASENYVLVGGKQDHLSDLRNGKDHWGVEPLASDTLSNNPEGLACFSSRGPTADGRLKPEIVAPGTNILSGRSHFPKASVLWGAYDDHYVWAGGTSMATPLTAGAAAVTRQFLIEKMKFVNPSGALVKATLMHTAHDMFPGQYGTGPTQEIPNRRPNVQEGYGRVDMDAVTSTDTLSSNIVDETSGVQTGETKSVNAQVGPDGLLHATLVYFDAPGLTSSAKSLVNDLSLEVRDASGKALATADTHLDNNETLELSGLSPGAYTVNVIGINVPQGHNGKQPYALVVTSRNR